MPNGVKHMKHLRTMGIVASALMLLFLTACGSNNNDTPTLNLSPTTADIILGDSRTFTVTAENTDFTVTGNGCVKNNSTTVICTPTSEGTHELTVTATADTSLTRKATMTVKKVDIAIATATGETEAEVMAGESVTFMVTTTNTDFTMMVPGGAGCVRANDEITCTPTVVGTYKLTVTATADTSKTTEATLTATEPGPVEIDGMVFVETTDIPFTMGCDVNGVIGDRTWSSSNCQSGSRPAHQVKLTKDFYIGKYVVTQAEWMAVMDGNNPSLVTGDDNLPVTNVSWDDVQIFIDKLNEQKPVSGWKWSLPAEAQWEYAARGGSQSLESRFCGYNVPGSAGDYIWHSANSDSKPHPVGEKLPNELGLHDMCGNVLEWVEDWYGPYSEGEQTDPTGPDSNSLNNHALRGGSYAELSSQITVAVRSGGGITHINKNVSIGFRLALIPTEP